MKLFDDKTFYTENIKGKSKVEILREIRNLKNGMNSFKRLAEDPGNNLYISFHIANANMAVPKIRLCIEKAKEDLANMGCVYRPTKSEIKDLVFQDNIEFISKIYFSIKGISSGHSNYVVTIDNKDIYYEVDHAFNEDEFPKKNFKPLNRREFLDKLKMIHLGEWNKEYRIEEYGYTCEDGIEWTLEIIYSNGTKNRCYKGINLYPYNFGVFRDLFSSYDFMDYSIDKSWEEDEEDFEEYNDEEDEEDFEEYNDEEDIAGTDNKDGKNFDAEELAGKFRAVLEKYL